MTDYDFNIWNKTQDPNFIDISLGSRIPYKWLAYSYVKNGKYSNSIIKPINSYVENLYPFPDLIDISNNTVRLRQRNHAEIALIKNEDVEFRDIDRPWMRQYYNSSKKHEVPKDCFPKTYLFYTPWIIDEDIIVNIEKPKEDSPFHIYPKQINMKKISINQEFVEPEFVDFNFKSVGTHMKTEIYGKIPRQSAMFDIVFEASGIMIERVKDFYEQN
jgi:hypothetical protein